MILLSDYISAVRDEIEESSAEQNPKFTDTKILQYADLLVSNIIAPHLAERNHPAIRADWSVTFGDGVSSVRFPPGFLRLIGHKSEDGGRVCYFSEGDALEDEKPFYVGTALLFKKRGYLCINQQQSSDLVVNLVIAKEPAPLHYGTAGAGSTSGSLVFAASPTAGTIDAVNDAYRDAEVFMIDGLSGGQTSTIGDYVASTRTASVESGLEPRPGDRYQIVCPFMSHNRAGFRMMVDGVAAMAFRRIQEFESADRYQKSFEEAFIAWATAAENWQGAHLQPIDVTGLELIRGESLRL